MTAHIVKARIIFTLLSWTNVNTRIIISLRNTKSLPMVSWIGENKEKPHGCERSEKHSTNTCFIVILMISVVPLKTFRITIFAYISFFITAHFTMVIQQLISFLRVRLISELVLSITTTVREADFIIVNQAFIRNMSFTLLVVSRSASCNKVINVKNTKRWRASRFIEVTFEDDVILDKQIKPEETEGQRY